MADALGRRRNEDKKMAKRKYYGEEAQKVTKEDLKASNAMIEQMKNGTFDFADFVTEPPTKRPVAEVVK